MQTYFWISITLFLAGFTQGLSGFGSALLALPLLSIFLDIKTVIPLVALAGMSMSLILFIRLREHIDGKRIFSLVGTLTGALFCDKISEERYRRIVLVLLLLLGALMIYNA